MTVGENEQPHEASVWPITVNDLANTQLATLVDAMCNDALENKSQHATRSLGILLDQVSNVIDSFHVQLYGKIQVVLFLLSGNLQNAEHIIRDGFFEPVHHPFLQSIYRDIVKRKGENLTLDDYCHYPRSIDPIYEDGLPKSLCDYLDTYYHYKRAEKKALNSMTVARKLKMSVHAVEARFAKCRLTYYRKKIMKKEKQASKEKELSSSENYGFAEEDIYNNPILMCYPSPPVETCHRFPLTRVPLDEPLTIQIPEDSSLNIPFFF